MDNVVAKLKEEGNKLFKEQKFIRAHEKYSEALKYDPSSFLLYSNRSLTSAKLKRFEPALSDALECIKHNPQWPKGFLRKAVALRELGRHEEVIQSAAEGFRWSGEGAIKRDLVSLWFEATERRNRLPEGALELPCGVVIMSEDYGQVIIRLMRSLNGEFPLSHSLMEQCLYNCAEQLKSLLRTFGESVSPAIEDWTKHLCREIFPYSTNLEAKTRLEQELKVTCDAFVSFLNKDVDPSLYPVLRPVLALIVLVILNRTNILTECNTGHHEAELTNRALLPLFEKSILSTKEYHTMYLRRLCAVLDSFIGRGYKLGNGELTLVRKYCTKLEEALVNYPEGLPEYQSDKNLAERALMNIRNNVLLPASVTPPQIPLSSSMSVELAGQIVRERPQEVKTYIEKHLQELETVQYLTMGEVEELLTMTG
jgi:tetratricopeptide (TPR) repeat protein